MHERTECDSGAENSAMLPRSWRSCVTTAHMTTRFASTAGLFDDKLSWRPSLICVFSVVGCGLRRRRGPMMAASNLSWLTAFRCRYCCGYFPAYFGEGMLSTEQCR